MGPRLRSLLTALAALVAMEPLTYAAHRWVMHGVGWVLHASHHQARARTFEANDAFPAIFASATVLVMAAGSRRPSRRRIQAVGAGVTAYGLAYGLVHDVYIHARLGRCPRIQAAERLKEAHRIHHLFGGEPYGMLAPVVPARLRAKAAGRTWDDPARDPLTRRAGARRAPAAAPSGAEPAGAA